MYFEKHDLNPIMLSMVWLSIQLSNQADVFIYR